MNNKLTNKDIETIEKEALKILDNFSIALEKVSKVKKVKEDNFSEFHLQRNEFERQEGEGKEGNENFKKEFLENAPSKNSDFIVVEKGEWKK